VQRRINATDPKILPTWNPQRLSSACQGGHPGRAERKVSYCVHSTHTYRHITGFDAARYPASLNGYLRNRQGENTVRFTLIPHLSIKIIDPFHGLYVADFTQVSFCGRQTRMS
jgi:hypothetical protein